MYTEVPLEKLHTVEKTIQSCNTTIMQIHQSNLSSGASVVENVSMMLILAVVIIYEKSTYHRHYRTRRFILS